MATSGPRIASDSTGSSSVQQALPESKLAPHEVAAGFFDQAFQLRSPQVAGMVLDRNRHPGIDRSATDRLEHAHRLIDPGLDPALAEPVASIAEDHAEGRRAQGLCHADAEG